MSVRVAGMVCEAVLTFDKINATLDHRPEGLVPIEGFGSLGWCARLGKAE